MNEMLVDCGSSNNSYLLQNMQQCKYCFTYFPCFVIDVIFVSALQQMVRTFSQFRSSTKRQIPCSSDLPFPTNPKALMATFSASCAFLPAIRACQICVFMAWYEQEQQLLVHIYRLGSMKVLHDFNSAPQKGHLSLSVIVLLRVNYQTQTQYEYNLATRHICLLFLAVGLSR